MPRYEYECQRCGTFEASQRMSDAPLTAHDCGAPAQRIISRTAFSLKGGGWYADGYGAGTAASAKDGGEGASKSSPANECASAECSPAQKAKCEAAASPKTGAEAA